MHTGDVVILVLSRYDRMLVKSLVIKVVYGLRHMCYDLFHGICFREQSILQDCRDPLSDMVIF